MGFADAVKSGLSKYATFQGRASRSEFWWFVVAIIIGQVVVGGVSSFLMASDSGVMVTLGTILLAAFYLGIILPSLALQVRRLHDIGKSGWWFFFQLVPAVGPIMLLIWFCKKGTDGSNLFGGDPLGGASLGGYVGVQA